MPLTSMELPARKIGVLTNTLAAAADWLGEFKEIQEFDLALVDEEGVHSEPAHGAEPTVLQEQREKEVEQKPGHSGRPT
jgi:hypothetical protein